MHLAEVWERRLGTLNKGSPAEAPRHRVHTARPSGVAEICFPSLVLELAVAVHCANRRLPSRSRPSTSARSSRARALATRKGAGTGAVSSSDLHTWCSCEQASLSRSGWRGSAREKQPPLASWISELIARNWPTGSARRRRRPCSRGCRTSSSLATRRQRSRPAASRCAPRLEGQRRGCCFAPALPP